MQETRKRSGARTVRLPRVESPVGKFAVIAATAAGGLDKKPDCPCATCAALRTAFANVA